MQMYTNLSGWLKAREDNIGPFSGYIIREVKGYEDSIKELMECLESTTYALEVAISNRKDDAQVISLIADFERAEKMVSHYNATVKG